MRHLPMMVHAALLGVACHSTQTVTVVPVQPKAAERVSAPNRVRSPLEVGVEHLARSRYREAEEELAKATAGKDRATAQLALAEVRLATGRYSEVIPLLIEAQAAGASEEACARLGAEAERKTGNLAAAETRLTSLPDLAKARDARLLLGEILFERGGKKAAETVLMSLIEDYQSGRIAENDGHGLALVGRAAHLLRSARDANQAFNESEQAGQADLQTLLWRSELFLEKYDPGHAEEVLKEALAGAPNSPEALVSMAQVRLAQTYDFDEAERLARRALQINPNLTSARFVLAGIALRDLELERAEQEIRTGLAVNPRDLELLSLRAAVRLLSDDAVGFDAARSAVTAINPTYTRMYEIIGDYAEWEHRYDEIVRLMREAVLIDGQDAAVRAALGINLIRAGDDASGTSQLELSFDEDPFNVRVYNTLNLYKDIIPSEYETVKRGNFILRYHKGDTPVLERYLPGLLDRAWNAMVKRYGFTPQIPVGVELYPNREHFAIRTSGLPNVGIQGVCFGQTLASVAPGSERFNIGMTLWHELSHVFHIQLSKSHVPRWFTEGLAEWETLANRQEWRREHDADLYDALRRDRIPHLQEMNRAFTRAEDMRDMATAYYASSRIMVLIQRRYGESRIARMLALWGQGKRTPQVIEEALGTTEERLDAEIRTFLHQELVRFDSQFMPIRRGLAGDSKASQVPAEKRDPKTNCGVAFDALAARDLKEASRAIEEALRQAPKLPDARFLEARLALARGKVGDARTLIEALIASGSDGYEPQMLLATVAERLKDLVGMKRALEAAHSFDPLASEALGELVGLFREAGDKASELEALRKLAILEEHEPAIHQRLLRLLNDAHQYSEAVRFGEGAIYLDMMGVLTHQLYAEGLLGANRRQDALFELETAVICPGTPEALADAHAQLAETLILMGDRNRAKREVELARKLFAENSRLKRITL